MDTITAPHIGARPMSATKTLETIFVRVAYSPFRLAERCPWRWARFLGFVMCCPAVLITFPVAILLVAPAFLLLSCWEQAQ